MPNAAIKAKAYLPVAALAIALTIGGCGSGDEGATDGGNANASDAAANGDGGNSRHTGQAAEIDKVLQANQSDFVDGDGEGFCSRLAPAGRRQVETVGRMFRIGRRCEPIIAELSRRSQELKQKPTKLLSVEIDGDRATAVVSDGGRKPQKLVFVKQDGTWKMPDPGFSTGPGGEGSDGSSAGAKPPPPAVPSR